MVLLKSNVYKLADSVGFQVISSKGLVVCVSAPLLGGALPVIHRRKMKHDLRGQLPVTHTSQNLH